MLARGQRTERARGVALAVAGGVGRRQRQWWAARLSLPEEGVDVPKMAVVGRRLVVVWMQYEPYLPV